MAWWEVVDWLQDGDLDAHVAVRAPRWPICTWSPFTPSPTATGASHASCSRWCSLGLTCWHEFGSIEEYLGRHAGDYYRALQQVQGGSYQPERDATPWLRFCITAHIQQTRERLGQVAAATIRWAALEARVESRGWPDGLVIALEQSLFEGAERKAYASEAAVSTATATTDLRRLLDAGLITQQGRTPSTKYHASDELRRTLASP
ncbi:MAG: Fic family protein [Solirubrobacterales bacterium]|nr:Fic family protein [Solirubrobacterales bacterium]